MHLFILSQENIELSEYELLSLLGIKKFERIDNIVIADINNKDKTKTEEILIKISRLAYTKKALSLLFECDVKKLFDDIRKYDFKSVYKKDFCLRIHDTNNYYNNKDKIANRSISLFSEKEYSSLIWKNLVSRNIKPKVNLDNSKTFIEIYIIGKRAYVCIQKWVNMEDFESRKAHQRPELHPTAMHPRMARALVNILNPKQKDVLLDPMCGAGGILTEAGLMNIKFKGYDIDNTQLNRARINMSHLNIDSKLYTLKRADATKIKAFKNIVTDLPYGKSSKKTEEINKLYANFIKNISGRAVVVFPDFSNYKKILQKNLNKKLGVKKIISHYVHKSLMRKIVIIDVR